MSKIYKIGYFIIGCILILLGSNIIENRYIPQGKRPYSHYEWDLSQMPIVAYTIGTIFILYGIYIFVILFKEYKKSNPLDT